MIRPVRSIVFYFISLFVWGLPLGMIMIAFPQVIIPAALQVTVLTLIFCSIGMLFKKDLSSWGSILGFGLVSVILATLLSSNFLHLSFVSSLSYYATVVIFLGYLIYDANIAMNLYPEAKKVGGLCLVSILLASSLDILQDIIILFMESILSDNDLDGDDFDSFW
ncbi:hypothetical protein FC32_GL000693 [Ligilactobacillus apodemi DSM 16634 = JCM 16172]|uniref:Integral membrane protein n=1 Tax=Ligilactobacillus apodemi DSM 16634 = JCM 16172 TaxID=1423724 RepID=A0A0R1TPP3_9LACO|nr:hypothetical protein FC32_GL000693 [Ligilactobacillus apodemi DSM 16634 = JCM 16172]